MSTKFDSTYSAVVSMAEQLVGEGKYDSTYSAVLAIYQNLTSDMDTKFDSVYSIVVTIADGIESGEIDLGGGGSGSDDIKDYNTHKFYNMNGELVEEWTLEETQSKTELPTIGGIPFDGWVLDFDGWNWDLEQLKSASCGQNIGAMYRPSDGKTRISVEIESENLNFILYVGGEYTIDWGDGTIETEWNTTYPTHIYESEGNYTITLNGTTINPVFGTSGNYNNAYEGYKGWYYNSRIKSFLSGVKLGTLDFGYCTNLEFLTFTEDKIGSLNTAPSPNFTETKSLKYLALPKGIKSYPQPGKSIEVISVPYGTSMSINSTILSGSASLKSVNIPDSVTSIKNYAFKECSSLQFINIPNSVTKFGEGAFMLCSSLQSVNIPDGVTSISKNAFTGCYSLQSVNIPDGVTSVGDSAFSGCTSLQSVNIPDGVTSIGNAVFNGCRSLQSVNIPDGVTSVGDSAFNACHALQSVNIPDGVTSIGYNMFYECYSLQSVNIPNSVTKFGDSVFKSCYSLQSVNIPDGVTSISKDMFYYCYSLQSVNIPDGVTSIGQSAFMYCRSLQSVNIPDGVTSISSQMFYDCDSLPYIKIPNSVTSIGGSVFYDCMYITVDFSDNTQVPTLSSSNAFNPSTLILVPESLYDEWISATNWSSLSSKIKPVPGK